TPASAWSFFLLTFEAIELFGLTYCECPVGSTPAAPDCAGSIRGGDAVSSHFRLSHRRASASKMTGQNRIMRPIQTASRAARCQPSVLSAITVPIPWGIPQAIPITMPASKASQKPRCQRFQKLGSIASNLQHDSGRTPQDQLQAALQWQNPSRGQEA